MNQFTKTPVAKRSRTIKKRPWLRTAQPRSIGIKISELPELTDVADADEVTTLAGGVNYRSPVSAIASGVNGITALRAFAPVNGRTVHLNYHTTAGDYGAGLFVGKTTGGPYTDNDGTIVVPTGGDGSAAWLRMWDGIECHVGWFGAKCDHVADDYSAVSKALSLFSNGRGSIGNVTGVINFGPGCNFAQPLYIVADGGYSIRLKGTLGQAGHIQMGSYLKYTGPAVYAAITFQASDSGMEDLNVYPGNAYNAVHATSDNTINTTTTHAITAGFNVVVTPASMQYIQVDCAILIDTGSSVEIVYTSAITATTFTADFRKDHASGVQVGHGPYSSGLRFRNCIFTTPYGPVPVNTVLASPVVAGSDVVLTTNQPHNIRVGMPIRLNMRDEAQTVYVKTVPSATTFTADVTISHAASSQVKYASAGFLMGNRPSGTVQVSEVAFETVTFRGDTPGYYPHAGFRQHQGGNVKNVLFTDVRYVYIDIGFEATNSSGSYVVNECIGACGDTIFRVGSGTWTVTGLEDESGGARLLVGGAGANPCWFNLIGGAMQYQLHTDDVAVNYLGQFTAIGCEFTNSRTGSSYAIIQSPANMDVWATSVVLINCNFPNADATSAIVRSGGLDLAEMGTAKVTMLGCVGGAFGSGVAVTLPNIVPPQTRWQNTATYDPPSLAANTAGTAQTMTVTGAALGDLVEASFSVDLVGAALRAWVSAANTVKYQFANPTAAPIDLGSGTVKVRVKK